jgi:hypothetical protein
MSECNERVKYNTDTEFFSSIEVTIVSVGQAVELTIFYMFVIVEEIPDIYNDPYKLIVLMKQ